MKLFNCCLCQSPLMYLEQDGTYSCDKYNFYIDYVDTYKHSYEWYITNIVNLPFIDIFFKKFENGFLLDVTIEQEKPDNTGELMFITKLDSLNVTEINSEGIKNIILFL